MAESTESGPTPPAPPTHDQEFQALAVAVIKGLPSGIADAIARASSGLKPGGVDQLDRGFFHHVPAWPGRDGGAGQRLGEIRTGKGCLRGSPLSQRAGSGGRRGSPVRASPPPPEPKPGSLEYIAAQWKARNLGAGLRGSVPAGTVVILPGLAPALEMEERQGITGMGLRPIRPAPQVGVLQNYQPAPGRESRADQPTLPTSPPGGRPSWSMAPRARGRQLARVRNAAGPVNQEPAQ